MTAKPTVKPVMLMILDGLGIREMEDGNAVAQANMPHYKTWLKTLERAVLDASGEAVGLVPDQMGNSEVGHLNLGAGRVVYQDISEINVTIQNGRLQTHPVLLKAFESAKANHGRVHLVGLVSNGGVHSHINHLNAMLDITKANDVQTIIHVITDGRDTPPNSGIGFVSALQTRLDLLQQGVIATVSGRYYAMDRDKRWERIKLAYDAIAFRQGEHANSAVEAMQQSYNKGVTDEFVLPTVVGGDESLAIKPGDSLIFYNFRADRMREIVQAFVLPSVDGFEGQHINNLHIVTFTEYMDNLPVNVVFGKESLVNTLAETLSKAGKSQYHSAETEKYPHVTFFFNGRTETPFPGEDRRIIPSPKVATYDLQPEMSAYELTEATLERLRTHDDDFILINYANPDMVGHTGSLAAAVKAVETVDECAVKLVDAVLAKGGVALVTADHGNCERMVEELTGDAHTYHTTNPVSLLIISRDEYFLPHPRGALADVAPTVLDLLDIPQPPQMTGRTLIEGRRPKA